MSGERGWCPEPGGPLAGMRVAVCGAGAAVRHAGRLLASLGATVQCGLGSWPEADGVIDADGALPAGAGVPVVRTVATTALEDWASSGAMALTGRSDGPALRSPGQPASVAWGGLLAAELLGRIGGRDTVLPGPRLLAERAAIAGLRRNAPSSPSGAFRLLRTADGWLGVNVARTAELLPAWLEKPVPLADPWPVLAEAVAVRGAGKLAERARQLGLPAALSVVDDEQLRARGQTGGVWPFVLNGHVCRASEGDPPVPAERRSWTLPPTLVVDLSSLWAGPLCGHLLTLLGARVVKVEDTNQPDGARFGPREFYDLLHGGQESVAVDSASRDGRAILAGLVEAADVVIEDGRIAARAEDALAGATDKCWVSISPYGRTGPWAGSTGFGDDAAVAGGLVAFDAEAGVPAPCGDAIAAPLTGVNAALVALACRLGGGTWLADLALREQAAATLVGTLEPGPLPPAAPPVAWRSNGRAAALGADTGRVLTELGLR